MSSHTAPKRFILSGEDGEGLHTGCLVTQPAIAGIRQLVRGPSARFAEPASGGMTEARARSHYAF